MKIRLAFTLVLCAIMICCVGCGQSTSEFPSLLSVTTVPSTTEFDQNISTTSDVPPKTTSIESYNDVANVGGATSCIHTLIYGDTELDNSYHSIDSVLIEYVGEDSFVAWITEKEANKSSLDVCPFNHINIVKFVEDFEIPRQVFEDLYYNFLYLQYDYDIDAIYNGTVAAENYYTSDRLQTVLEKKTIRLFKSKLVDYVNTQNSTAFSIQMWRQQKFCI